MGSGSTAIACIREKRRFIGIELDKKYFAAAVERIEAELGAKRIRRAVARIAPRPTPLAPRSKRRQLATTGREFRAK
jgi:site-specific DNA-methyltransferase (adenine-specific)